MNTFAKKNDRWVVKLDAESAPGQPATIHLRNGGTKQVTLGAFIEADDYGHYYDVAPPNNDPSAGRMRVGHGLNLQGQPHGETIGDLSRIVGMFAHAAQYLKYPAVVLDGFRVSIAGERAKEPGSLTVTAIEKVGARRPWFGRVSLTGVWQPGRDAPAGLGEKLRAFAADPVGVAATQGRLNGKCCFCRKPLGEGEDRRSVEIGYGPICADHFHLPWGARGTQPEYQYDQARMDANSAEDLGYHDDDAEQHSAMERENMRMERD